jgi:muconolactone delta-isomerase
LLEAGLPVDFDADELLVLLEEARSRLRPRARFPERFAEALLRSARRLLRFRAFAAVARQHEAARRKRAADEAAARQRAESVRSAPADPELVADVAEPWRAIEAALARPLHRLSPLERARRLAEHGLSLVALPPRSKRPPDGSTWVSAQERRARVAVLATELAALGAEAGLAIVCGPVSGIVVADLDDGDAVRWAHDNLPTTPWRTRTARGEHWFYRLPEAWVPPTTVPWKGQLQAAGRYVVAPGSLHPDSGQPYEALGDWTAPKSSLPTFDLRWLTDQTVRRAARLRVLKPDE